MIIAALRTATAGLVLSLYVLIVGPPAMLWTALTRDRRPIYAAGALALRLGFGLAGIQIRVAGSGQPLPDRAVVYASNHNSNVDPPVVFFALRRVFPRLRVLYKAELRALPILVWVFDIAGFVPIERANRDQSFPAVDRAAQALRDGASFLIFPEGTRSRTGELLPFKKGGIVMAIKAQAPIVPIAVTGGRDAMRKGSPVIRPSVVTVRIGTPIETTGRTLADRDLVAGEVREAVAQALRG